jgi:DNA-binding response OmpR family regulator
MLRIVFATTRLKTFQAFADALSSDPEVQLKTVASGADALAATPGEIPHLVIVDSSLPDTTPFQLVQKLLLANAMINTAVVSPLSEAEFHEASEGLGILGRLPTEPGGRDAADLLHKLRAILGGMR